MKTIRIPASVPLSVIKEAVKNYTLKEYVHDKFFFQNELEAGVDYIETHISSDKFWIEVLTDKMVQVLKKHVPIKQAEGTFVLFKNDMPISVVITKNKVATSINGPVSSVELDLIGL